MNTLSFFSALKHACEDIDTRKARGKKFSLFEALALVSLGLMMLHDRFALRCTVRIFTISFAITGPQKQLEDFHADEGFLKKWRNDRADAERELAEKAAGYIALLRTLSPFKHGIPSYSCLSRVLKTLDLAKLTAEMNVYIIDHLPDGGIRNLILDGKALLGAQNKGRLGFAKYMINVLDAKSGLFLTTIPVGAKKNEVSTLSDVLVNILLGGRYIVSADAMATQRIIIDIIVKMGSDYVFPVKGNQKVLMRLLRWCMTRLGLSQLPDNLDYRFSYYTDLNGCEDEAATGYITATNVVIKEEDYSIPVEAYVEDKDSDAENAEQVNEILDSEGADGTEIESTTDSANGESVCFSFFGNLYDYQDPGLPELEPGNLSGHKVIYVRVKSGNDYIWIKLVRMADRWERREVQFFADREWLDQYNVTGFESVCGIGMVTRYRLVEHHDKKAPGGMAYTLSITRTPFISSMLMDAKTFGSIVRGEWSIEMAHRDLDVEMGEDRSTISAGNGPYATSVLRKMVRNLEVMIASAWNEASEHVSNVKEELKNVRQTTLYNFNRCFHYMGQNFAGIDQIF